MSMSLSAFLIGEKNRLWSTTGWVVGVECPIDAGTGTLRAVDDNAPFTFGGNVYYPASISVDENTTKSDGSLEALTLTVGNLTRDLTQLLEDQKLDGKSVLLRAFHRSSNQDSIDWDFQVMAASAGWRDVQFILGHANLFKRPFPKNRFSKSSCRHIYKSAACGYSLSLVSCDKTLDGSNGCRVHGDDEVANGQPRQHPNRYGGFPTIPDDR